jgi:hypothetical protein
MGVSPMDAHGRDTRVTMFMTPMHAHGKWKLPMNRDIGGPRSVVAHFRDPPERVPPFPVHGSNASNSF